MKLDKQTLAWFNKDKYWIRQLKPNFRTYQSSGGLAENANLPDTLKPTWIRYFNRITNQMEDIISHDKIWGFEKWHHSSQLINNNCKCPRCNFDGNDDEWWFMPMGYWDHVNKKRSRRKLK